MRVRSNVTVGRAYIEPQKNYRVVTIEDKKTRSFLKLAITDHEIERMTKRAKSLFVPALKTEVVMDKDSGIIEKR